MKKGQIKKIFPEQSEPIKLSGLDDGKDAGELNDLSGSPSSLETDDMEEFISSPAGSSSARDMKKEKYLREIARIEDLPEDEDSTTSTNDQSYKSNTGQPSGDASDTKTVPEKEEGRTNEWQDRARVSKEQENMDHKASPRQSNIPAEDIEDVEEKSPKARDTFY